MKVYLEDVELDEVRRGREYVPAVLANLDGLHVAVTVRHDRDGDRVIRDAMSAELRSDDRSIALPEDIALAVCRAAQEWLDSLPEEREEPEYDPAESGR